MSDEKRFKQILLTISELAGVTLSPITVGLYDVHLGQKYGYDRVNPLLERYCLEASKTRRLPAVSEIEEALGVKTPTIDDMARDVAATIESALSKHGYTNEGRAMDYIGSLGRELITTLGGWVPFCMSIDSYDQMPSIRKQLRELAEGRLRMMPEPARQKVLPPESKLRLKEPENGGNYPVRNT